MVGSLSVGNVENNLHMRIGSVSALGWNVLRGVG
jgi:hypothetical protein